MALEELKPVVLFLDDEEDLLNAIQRLLRQEPYRIMCTTDPQAALSIVATESPQLVVSDYRMAAMNGIDFIRKVCDVYPACVRVIYSGYAEEAALQKAIAENVLDHVITKPWDSKTIKTRLISMLEGFHSKGK